MEANLDPAAEIRARLQTNVPVEMLTADEQDRMLQTLYKAGMHENLLTRLAEHYGVNFKGLRDLLIARQLVFLHLMTDYNRSDNEASLQETLCRQQTALMRLRDKMTARLSDLETAITETAILREQASQLLAAYKTKLMLHKSELGNP